MWIIFLTFPALFFVVVVVVSRRFQGGGRTMFYFYSSAIANMISFHSPLPRTPQKEGMKEMFTFMMFASIQTEHLSFFQYTHTLLLERKIYIFYISLYFFISFFHWVAKDSSLQATDFLSLYYIYIEFSCVCCFYALSVTTVMKSGKFKFLYFFSLLQVLSI